MVTLPIDREKSHVLRRGAAWTALMLGLLCPLALSATEATGPDEVIARLNRDLANEVASQGNAMRDDNQRRIAVVDQVASEHTDFEYMAKLVLGQGWVDATFEQRSQFVSQFRTLLLWTFAQQVVDYVNGETQLSAPQTDASNNVALVRTRVAPSSGPAKQVNYRLRVTNGQWKVFDVAVDGVSIISMYRSSFSSQVAKEGMDGLIARLAEKNRMLQGT